MGVGELFFLLFFCPLVMFLFTLMAGAGAAAVILVERIWRW